MTVELSEQLLFLPGASGNTRLWAEVAAGLAHPGEKLLWGWPGFGGVPPDPQVQGIDDLVTRVVKVLDRPTDCSHSRWAA